MHEGEEARGKKGSVEGKDTRYGRKTLPDLMISVYLTSWSKGRRGVPTAKKMPCEPPDLSRVVAAECSMLDIESFRDGHVMPNRLCPLRLMAKWQYLRTGMPQTPELLCHKL